MFKSLKRLLILATVTLTVSAPSVANAFMLAGSGRSSTSGQTHSPIVGSMVSASQGFQWGDAAIGAAAALVLLSIGATAIFVIRQWASRTRQPLAS
jgi:hypothetical protein